MIFQLYVFLLECLQLLEEIKKLKAFENNFDLGLKENKKKMWTIFFCQKSNTYPTEFICRTIIQSDFNE